MGRFDGGIWDATAEWKGEFGEGIDKKKWLGKVDAIAITVARFYIILFLISLLISVIGIVYAGRVASKVESFNYGKNKKK